MDIRLNRLNKFVLRMADIKINRHPQRKKATIIFNDTRLDIYNDAIREEECRVEKNVIVRKNPDMMFVQSMFYNELIEDTDKLPWVVDVTITNLPRLPKNDDMLLITDNGKEYLYSISSVKPINRDTPVVLVMLVYPERTEL